MRVLIAPDKFKGSLTAMEACEAIGRGWKAAWPETECCFAPIADGGEGFADSLRARLGGEWIEAPSHDALGRPIRARYAWISSERLAVLEMSEASGLWRIRPEERDPLLANTFGTGELIRHATAHGAQKIIIGLGGSATTDAGLGMAAALGYDLYTSDGDPLAPHPGKFIALTRIGSLHRLELPPILAACDVQNPLLGPNGSAHIFGPQKGADPKTVAHLETAMETVADVVAQEFGQDFRATPSAGAAGGLGFGLMSFCGAEIRTGFEVVAEIIGLREKIAACDIVITGEGRIDGQTLEGKAPAGVARLARSMGKPVLAFAGSISSFGEASELFDAVLPITNAPMPLEEALESAAALLEGAAATAAQLIQTGSRLAILSGV